MRRKRLQPPAPGKAVCGQRLSGTKAPLPEQPFPLLFSGRREAEPFYGPRRVPAMRPFRAYARRALCPGPKQRPGPGMAGAEKRAFRPPVCLPGPDALRQTARRALY
ncbi:MAG: hypothetical protein DBY17_07850 [Oscillospiraceae bacterium]|nr:MAG: hypothetical protein DBY17_07850 [Oscillospiraceae bacterium]